MATRETIFISHSNPEENFFAAWLASKLKLFGYKVWCDVRDVKPGQYFNRDFEQVIREDAMRFLAVVSKDYIEKSKRDDTGVMNEILCARTVKDIEGFIVPLLYDNSEYNEFTVGLRGRLAVSFNNNWADGLHELLKLFEEISVPKNPIENNIIDFWHESRKINPKPIEKPEKYLTNWFPANLPEHIYIHQPKVLLELDFATMPFTYIREGDRLISFVSTETLGAYTELNSSYELQVTSLFTPDTIIVDQKFSLSDPNRKIVKLLNKSLRSHLTRAHLKKYEQANKKEIFYFGYSPENLKAVSLKQIGKTRRTVIGKSSEFTWYFAISHSASLFPIPCFRIFYTLVFTDNHGKPLSSDDQHTLRRSHPSDWYNREWLERLLAMMLKIANFDSENLIKIPVDSNKFLTVNVLPIDITSSIGYNEPGHESET